MFSFGLLKEIHWLTIGNHGWVTDINFQSVHHRRPIVLAFDLIFEKKTEPMYLLEKFPHGWYGIFNPAVHKVGLPWIKGWTEKPTRLPENPTCLPWTTPQAKTLAHYINALGIPHGWWFRGGINQMVKRAGRQPHLQACLTQLLSNQMKWNDRCTHK